MVYWVFTHDLRFFLRAHSDYVLVIECRAFAVQKIYPVSYSLHAKEFQVVR